MYTADAPRADHHLSAVGVVADRGVALDRLVHAGSCAGLDDADVIRMTIMPPVKGHNITGLAFRLFHTLTRRVLFKTGAPGCFRTEQCGRTTHQEDVPHKRAAPRISRAADRTAIIIGVEYHIIGVSRRFLHADIGFCFF